MIGGHGTSIGGVITDGGNFDWNNGNFDVFTKPSVGYHGLIFGEQFSAGSPSGNIAFIVKARVEGLRDLGPSISPFNSFLLLQGLETLSLRMDRHVATPWHLHNGLSSAFIDKVNYPGLPDSPYFEGQEIPSQRQEVYLLLYLRLKDPKQQGLLNFQLSGHLANIGDAKTLIIQPQLPLMPSFLLKNDYGQALSPVYSGCRAY